MRPYETILVIVFAFSLGLGIGLTVGRREAQARYEDCGSHWWITMDALNTCLVRLEEWSPTPIP